jgi:hypothetical protein
MCKQPSTIKFGFFLQIALRFVEESEESSLAKMLLIKQWRDITTKKVVKKKFKLKYQIFFVEICSVVLYL